MKVCAMAISSRSNAFRRSGTLADIQQNGWVNMTIDATNQDSFNAMYEGDFKQALGLVNSKSLSRPAGVL